MILIRLQSAEIRGFLIACNGRVGYVMIGGDESGITEVNYFTES